ncbi:hypothetical protein [Neptuniibacter halophilus]|uniref:hypothetical protein n=1 Tax=Neptuniibacter halophilus TaxID=651666 RepID=UPI002573CC47|nr:hypothetical protein [Neptuniibacter halophilus]
MSPTYIALIILLGVAVMAGIGFAVQDIENKKRERNLRLIGLKTAIRRASHLFESFPPILMTSDIRALLVKYLEVRWDAVVELDGSESNRSQQAAFKAAASSIQDAVSHPSGSMTVFPTSIEASRALGVIKEFAQFIAELKNKGEIKGDVADKLTKEARRLYARVEVDIDLMSAIETEQQRGPEVVIHHYRSCFSKLQNLNHNQSLDRQLYEIRTHLTQLAEEIDRLNEEKRVAEEQEKDSGKKFNF